MIHSIHHMSHGEISLSLRHDMREIIRRDHSQESTRRDRKIRNDDFLGGCDRLFNNPRRSKRRGYMGMSELTRDSLSNRLSLHGGRFKCHSLIV